MHQPRLSNWQISNMSIAFMGIQFGWALQSANMTPIYEYLGATPDQIPFLWIASSLTGLLVQPIVGHFSDHTHGKLGRRRPYLLAGSVASVGALALLPNATSIALAVALLWLLDAALNTAMHPLRALVTDKVPEDQRTRGFTMQSLYIGLGATIASALPWMMTHCFGVTDPSLSHVIPNTVRYSFYIGGAVFLLAVLWTVCTTHEEVLERSDAHTETQNPWQIMAAIRDMPRTMWQLGAVQTCTWLGLFCLFLYFPTAVARHIFGATDEMSPLYREGIEWAGLCFSMFSVVTVIVSFLLAGLANRVSRKSIHSSCLLIGGLGLISISAIHSKELLFLSMAAFGVAWASILAMPYAMLAGSLPPHKAGTYVGIFNLFIVVPQITGSLGFGWVMNHLLQNDRMNAVVTGGVLLILAALLTQRVQEPSDGPARVVGPANHSLSIIKD